MRANHDIHTHTTLSKCCETYEATAKNYIENAAKMGLKVLGFSDHMWDSNIPGQSRWYRSQNQDHILMIKNVIPEDTKGVNVLVGCEAEFAQGTLAITPETAAKLDYVLVPHSHTHMKGFVLPLEADTHEKHAKYLLESFLKLVTHKDHKLITSVAHPFCPGVNRKEYESILTFITNAQFKECFMAAKENGIGIEINTSIFSEIPREVVPYCNFFRMFKIAKECGCSFSAGTDSHSLEDYKYFDYFDIVSDLLGITEDDYIPLIKNLTK